MDFSCVNSLCSRTDSFSESTEIDDLFWRAMRENYQFQWITHPYIRELGARRGFSPSDLNDFQSSLSVPHLFVGVMKLHSFLSVPAQETVLTLTSSGTGGQKTHIVFDSASLARLQALATSCFDAMGFRGSKPVHAFLMSYDPRHAGDVGTTWSDEQILALSPVLSHHWTIGWNAEKQGYHFDAPFWAEKFAQCAQEAPVRLLGFPAFMCELVEELKRQKRTVRVHPESFIVAGGGWKNHRGNAMSLSDFCSYMEDSIGFPRANIRDTFGMAEHGVPYCSCPHGNYHAPIYARIVARDPLTLSEVPLGEEGLLHLLTPYHTAQPNLSVLSTDVVTLGRGCSCGTPGVFIRAIRRGGVKKSRGCAVAAQGILDAGKGAKS
jgi:phenylacetate-coenzyme A ligase PaaK-like adenylate-forming protein